MFIPVRVEGLLLDSRSCTYILLLKSVDGNDTFPIWIGKAEAESIAIAMAKVMTPRPLSHDLIKNILEVLKMSVSKVVVRAIIDDTYYATLYINDDNLELPLDSRPCDAIAIALRTNSPIYVEEEAIKTKNTKELEEWLKYIKPDDFSDSI